jgi:uncharacterized protein YdeI (YjbR/CyaY-like superfamily)
MAARDPRIDQYIAEAEPFARPILRKIRTAVHAGCPAVVETMKWQLPFFDYKGPLCTMGAFKAHARFVFWKSQPLAASESTAAIAIARLKRLTSVADLPDRRALVALVKAAVSLNDRGVKGPIARRTTTHAAPEPSDELLAAFAREPRARKAYNALPASHRREYLRWIAGAKRADTRARRIEQAIERILDRRQP